MIKSIENKLSIFWNRSFATTFNDDKSLSIIRIIFSCAAFIFYIRSIGDFTYINSVPQALFNPPILSIANLFDGFPEYPFLNLMQGIFWTLIIGLIFGIKARFCGLGSSIILIFLTNFNYSFGKINHSTFLPIICLFFLSFTNWGSYYALIPDKKINEKYKKFSLSILALSICFGMFTAGYPKAISWIDFNLDENGFLKWFYGGYINLDRRPILGEIVKNINPKLFEILDWSAVIFELTPFIAFLLGRKYWNYWLIVAIFFHFGNFLLLDISFLFGPLCYLVFFPLENSFIKNIIIKFKNISKDGRIIIINAILFSLFIYFALSINSYSTFVNIGYYIVDRGIINSNLYIIFSYSLILFISFNYLLNQNFLKSKNKDRLKDFRS